MKPHLLRKVFLLLVVSCSLHIAKAQWVTIPDNSVVAWFNNNGYASCMNGNQLDTTCPAVVNEDSILVSFIPGNSLEGIQYFDNLAHLTYGSVGTNTTIPRLPSTLKYLRTQSGITSLPPLPSGLEHLILYLHLLPSLPALPPSLVELDCRPHWNNHSLLSLPALPAGLKILTCDENFRLKSLPPLPPALEMLTCSEDSISVFPTLPNGLRFFSCWWMKCPVTLPATFPDSLRTLRCDTSFVTSIASLPPNLENLFCGNNNQLTSLPPLPATLKSLDCEYLPGLTSLPPLPSTLKYLRADWCNLNSLPALPDTMYQLHVTHNPGLGCLPKLNVIHSLKFTYTWIHCLPNYGEVLTSEPDISLLNLCDMYNAIGCPISWNVSGRVYVDTNNNCLYDGNEAVVQNMNVYLNEAGSSQQTNTGRLGHYSFDAVDFGNYSLSIDTVSLFDISCPSNNLISDTLAALDSLHADKDFALTCKPGFDLEAGSIVPGVFRPTAMPQIAIGAGDASNFYGAHCAAGVSGTVTVILDGPLSYFEPAGSALTPIVNGDTLTYTVSDFGDVSFLTDFSFIVHIDTFAQIGQQGCVTLSVTPVVGDNNPANNILVRCFDILNSFDPNDKQVYPAGDIDTSQEWLTYTVRFQNTGNDYAENIYIDDTLDSHLEVNTFRMLAYSHQPMVQIKENVVRFNFPGIYLPDTLTSEPESHGYVQYKIKLKDNLPIGTVVNNTAFIYFDFNAPVVTNTTVNTIALVSGIQQSAISNPQFEMFPNPVNDVVTISIDQSMLGGVLSVTDITGRRMAAVSLTTRYSPLAIHHLLSGVYFVTVTDKEGRSATKKLVVNK